MKLLEDLFVYDVWYWWLFVVGAAALLSVALFYYGDAALALLGTTHKGAWSEDNITTIISTASFVRDSLAVVIMLYFFQRAVMVVVGSYVALPPV
jgi:hypothetical protein